MRAITTVVRSLVSLVVVACFLLLFSTSWGSAAANDIADADGSVTPTMDLDRAGAPATAALSHGDDEGDSDSEADSDLDEDSDRDSDQDSDEDSDIDSDDDEAGV